MKQFSKISILFTFMALVACTAELPVLDDSSQLAVGEEPDKGTPALMSNKGVLDDFGGEIYGWWAGDNLTLTRKGDTLKVVALSIGPKYTPFGREFNLWDMKEANVLKVRMRAEGTTPPLIGISLKDVNGFDTNADRPKAKVKISSEYIDYYFNYNEKWQQSYPNSQKVDETMIASIMFFINPGGAEWTGTLYIDGIVAMKEADMPKVEVVAGGMIDDFSEEIYSWSSSSDKISLERKNDILNVTCAETGAGYENISNAFGPVNMAGEHHIIRMKARAEGASPDFRITLKDKKGFDSNGSPVVQKIEVSDKLKNYYFDFNGKWTQAWPNAQTLNPETIMELLMMINAGGQPAPYTGTIFIDELEVITEKKMQELKALGE